MILEGILIVWAVFSAPEVSDWYIVHAGTCETLVYATAGVTDYTLDWEAQHLRDHCIEEPGDAHVAVTVTGFTFPGIEGSTTNLRWYTLWGADIDRNNTLDVRDWRRMARCLAGWDLDCSAADINNNGTVDAIDELRFGWLYGGGSL